MAFQRGFKIDLTRCIGCRACAVACINENNLDPYQHWRDVIDRWSGTYPNTELVHVTMACFHCNNPSCLAACPVNGAIVKDPDDGVVLIDQDLCVGCRRCEWACPYGNIRWNEATQKVDKCTFCKHRVGDNISPTHIPACVATCPGKALTFGVVGTDITLGAAQPTGFAKQSMTLPSVQFVV